MNRIISFRASAVAKNQLVRFVAVGALNTSVGYAVFLLLALGLGVHAAVSNAAAYAVGLTLAYFLYRDFVFDASVSSHTTVWSFIACFVISFLLNQAV